MIQLSNQGLTLNLVHYLSSFEQKMSPLSGCQQPVLHHQLPCQLTADIYSGHLGVQQLLQPFLHEHLLDSQLNLDIYFFCCQWGGMLSLLLLTVLPLTTA